MENFVTRSNASNHTFRFECFVDFSTEFGKMLSSLNSLDHLSDNSDQFKNKDHSDIKTNIYDCLKLFEQPERLGEDNEWYCSNCKKH